MAVEWSKNLSNMDVVDLCRHLYKVYEGREEEISSLLTSGMAKDISQYRQLVGEVQGLRFARDEIKSLLEKTEEDVEDTLRS